MNGRMMDTYRRIHGTCENFFVPHDFEMSVYELRDPLVPTFVEESTHIAIYKLEYSGERTLYRHFLRTNDGAIIELFGDVGSVVGAEYKQLEGLLLASPRETPRAYERAPDDEGDEKREGADGARGEGAAASDAPKHKLAKTAS